MCIYIYIYIHTILVHYSILCYTILYLYDMNAYCIIGAAERRLHPHDSGQAWGGRQQQ